MTVAELIEKLLECDRTFEVEVSSWGKKNVNGVSEENGIVYLETTE